MIYDIFSRTAPAMPKPGKGTEIVKLLLTQASKDMYEPLVPMFFPIFGAHMSGAEFQYPDLSSVPRPQLEGADGLNGQSGGKKWR